MNNDKKLNAEQLAAVNHTEGPLLIIAGAGTGKTTVVTERIKFLILEKHIDPKNILALTFTEKASREMQERIDIALPYGYTQMWISTFHSFCDRILRDEAIHIGLNPAYKLATETEMILFLRKHLFKLDLEYFRPLGNPNKFLQGLLQHFGRLKDEDITPEQYLQFVQKQFPESPKSPEEIEEKQKYLELAHAYAVLEKLKIQEGIMDFGDLIMYTLQLLRKRKHILKQYQDKFQYILIDEFQDTNYAQNQLGILLAGKHQNLTVVGDDDQAIYRWRGAAISNMVQFTKHFPKTTIITLTKNYRSTKNILDSAYQLIQYNNPDRLEIREKVDKKLLSVRNIPGQPIGLLLASTGDNEAEIIVEKIQELITEKKYTYKDFAILVRANDHAQPFIRAFERARIPFQFLGPGQLFHREEIKDLIAYLKVLYDFSDSSSLYRVLTMPIWKIPATEITALLHEARINNKTLFEALLDPPSIQIGQETRETLAKIVQMIRLHLEKVSKESAGQILYNFLEDSGLLQSFIEINSSEEELIVQNVTKFFDKLKDFESEQNDASVFAVVDWLDLAMQLGESPLATNIDWTENNAINILTIHSSKGLEFPVVFVVNLVSQRFPSRERKEQIPIPQNIIKEQLPEGDFHLQEERRLFYVAMTRAKDFLFLTAASVYGDGKKERKTSPFLIEALGEEIIEKAKQNHATNKTLQSLSNLFPKQQDKPLHTDNKPYSIQYISYSQLQTFEICPLHYKLKYILKIPSPANPALVFGTILHAALKDFYTRAMQGDNPKIEDIKTILRDHWTSEGYQSKAHEKIALEKSAVVLKNYLQKNYDPSLLPIAVETPFTVPLNESLHLGGRIDRIDAVGNNTLEIIDYKTGANIPDAKDVAKNFQLTLYALAVAKIHDPLLHRDPKHVQLSLHYLESNTKFTTTRTAEQLEKAHEDVVAKVKEISESNFQCSGTMLCQNCEYKMLCKTN